jgi:V/A-type H+-transporting ATPase subunit A
VGEPVAGAGKPLTVRLGPGLLGGMFDGLQRPLERIKENTGPFIARGTKMEALDFTTRRRFTSILKKGDVVRPGLLLGTAPEMSITHCLMSGPGAGGTISRVLDGEFSLNDPLAEYEDGGLVYGHHEWPVRIARPYRRKFPAKEALVTGQRCIDFLFPLVRGGTAIFPGGFGTGKTILEQALAKFADADIVVYVGCGERGNEMADVVAEFSELRDPRTNRPLRDRTILVVNTSNMPVAAREASIYTAVAMAEYYRDMGYHVLFLADSLSRWAEALREISVSLEEMPGEEGYPTYLASRLSAFLERAGVVEAMNGKIGALSMILSVSPPGGDFTEPVTQACLRTAGAFLMLDTSLAHRRHFPAINWFQSYSLYFHEATEYFQANVSAEWTGLLMRCRSILQKEESLKETAELVGSEGLQDADRLLMRTAGLIRTDFLRQNAYGDDSFSSPEMTLALIKRILAFHDQATEKLQQGRALGEALAEEKAGG